MFYGGKTEINIQLLNYLENDGAMDCGLWSLKSKLKQCPPHDKR